MFGNELIDEVAAFLKSRVILSAAALDIFTCLDTQPASAAELAGQLGTDVRATTRVLDCLVGFDLVVKDSDNRYHLTGRGKLLSSRHPDTVLPMLLHMDTMWDGWSHLTETIIGGTNPHRIPLSETTDPDISSAFIGAMHVLGKTLAREIVATYDMGCRRCLLDIGGGSGVYTIAFLEQYPNLSAIIFDRPHILAFAREKIDQAGLASRVKLVPGDFYVDELPGGSDCALLSAIIHQNSPSQNVELFKKVLRCLDPGGALLIRDHIMEPSRTRPHGGALFAINMLVNTPGGDTYTFDEVRAQLADAGFVGIKMIRTGERMDCLVQAVKPTLS